MTADRRCRSCGSGRPARRSSSLGRRRWRTRCSPSEQLDAARADVPARPRVLPRCTLVQITETVPPEILFRDYLYFSSFSDTMLAHAEALATRWSRERELGAGQPGGRGRRATTATCCSTTSQRGVPVLGIEPAAQHRRRSREERGIPTLAEFFGATLAERLAGEGTPRRRVPRQQRAGARRRPERLRRGHRDACSSRRRRRGHRGALRQGHDRPLRVRHDLPRAPLLLLADRARARCSAGTGWRSRTSSALPIHGGSLRVFVDARGTSRRRDARHRAARPRRRPGASASPASTTRFALRVTELGSRARRAARRAEGERRAASPPTAPRPRAARC